ncbi:MAG TPA: FmdB family zinc ribbon protein [Acidimicrobiales bacterium]
MPTYEYACTACGHRFDAVQRFTDEPLTECPECEGALRKVYGAVGIVLKGSGFYKTDSRAAASSNGKNGSGSKRSESAAGDSSGSGSDSDSSTSSDSGSTSSTSDKGTSDKKDAKSTTPAASTAS